MTALYTLEEAREILFGDVGDEYRQLSALGEHLHDYLRRQTEPTRKAYGTYLKKIALYHPDKGPKDWRAADLDDAIVACAPEASHEFVRYAVRGFFRWLEDRDEVERNEANRIRPYRKVAKDFPTLFTEEEQMLLRHLPQLRDRALAMLLLGSGMRNSEARATTCGDVNFDTGTIKVLGKGRKYRFIPLPPVVLAILHELGHEEALRDEDFLWYRTVGNQHRKRVTRNRMISDDALRAWWARCLEYVGIEYRWPHIARHTYATLYMRHSKDSTRLSRILGHSSSAVTDRTYTHLEVSDLREGVDEVFARRGWE